MYVKHTCISLLKFLLPVYTGLLYDELVFTMYICIKSCFPV